MEDIDPQRSRESYTQAAIEDLLWLGLDWDEGPDPADLRGTTGPYAPYTQSLRLAAYEQALRTLEVKGSLYPCFCTRKELRALASAPHIGDEGAPYPGICRDLTPEQQALLRNAGRSASLRVRCPAQQHSFIDLFQGPQRATPEDWGGDFALRRSDGVMAYQLAVVVDDGLMHINQVVRGRDLLSSTPRQLLLFRLLDMPAPNYAHIPLLCDEEGERLAKRHASLSLRALREAGVSASAITGYLAWKSGLMHEVTPVHPRHFLSLDSLDFPLWWHGRDILLDADPLKTLLALG